MPSPAHEKRKHYENLREQALAAIYALKETIAATVLSNEVSPQLRKDLADREAELEEIDRKLHEFGDEQQQQLETQPLESRKQEPKPPWWQTRAMVLVGMGGLFVGLIGVGMSVFVSLDHGNNPEDRKIDAGRTGRELPKPGPGPYSELLLLDASLSSSTAPPVLPCRGLSTEGSYDTRVGVLFVGGRHRLYGIKRRDSQCAVDDLLVIRTKASDRNTRFLGLAQVVPGPATTSDDVFVALRSLGREGLPPEHDVAPAFVSGAEGELIGDCFGSVLSREQRVSRRPNASSGPIASSGADVSRVTDVSRDAVSSPDSTRPNDSVSPSPSPSAESATYLRLHFHNQGSPDSGCRLLLPEGEGADRAAMRVWPRGKALSEDQSVATCQVEICDDALAKCRIQELSSDRLPKRGDVFVCESAWRRGMSHGLQGL